MCVKSILDSDFYKFTMGYFVFKYYRGVPVTYTFIDRKNMKLAKIIPVERLREELDKIRNLSVTKTELHYLRGTNEYNVRMFDEDYLTFLSNLKLPEYLLEVVDGNFILKFSGYWEETIYWETLALSTINELYYQYVMKDFSKLEKEKVHSTGIIRLKEKVDIIKLYRDLKIVDFGTRRRFSFDWQNEVLQYMSELPQFIGTSNTKLAMDLNMLPMGTFAHELPMGVTAVERSRHHFEQIAIKYSHDIMLSQWWKLYGEGLSIALTDTYGSEFFFESFGPENARNWKGIRHDSGDPELFALDALSFYDKNGIDARKKLLIFSDGLDIHSIINLYILFSNRIGLSFGWGTNLTNDLGIPDLHIVVKLQRASGIGTVKLSDTPGKEMGSPNDVNLFKKIFKNK